MDKEYFDLVTEAAIEKLSTVNRPLSENEFVRGLVALLKKKHGKDDTRHSSKVRFRKETFRQIINTQNCM